MFFPCGSGSKAVFGGLRMQLVNGAIFEQHGVVPHWYIAFGDEDVVFLSAVSPPIELVTSA